MLSLSNLPQLWSKQPLRKKFNNASIALWGMGLAGSIWILDNVTDVLGDWMPAIVLGSAAVWGYGRLSQSPKTQLVRPKAITVDQVKRSLIETEQIVNQVAAELATLTADDRAGQTEAELQVAALRSQLNEILVALKREELQFAIVGSQGVGKTSLHDWLQAHWLTLPTFAQKLQLCDTPELLSPIAANTEQAMAIAKKSDLVIWVLQGDLLDSELQILQTLNQAYRRTVIVLNKQDQYLPKEQDQLLAQIRSRVSGMIAPGDVIAIATQPRPIKVRQYQEDGTVQEWIEEPEPTVNPLVDRLQQILIQDAQKLILASSIGNAEALKAQARQQLNQKRRSIALPVIERSQWVVAGTAFATPFPALDLLATAAINGQMVVELSQLYQQKFSIDQAKQIATSLAEIMIKLGIVEVSTQGIAALLKTNAFTYMAGGVLQGVSGAYLTRIAGLSLIEYWESERDLSVGTPPTDSPQNPDLKLDRLQPIVQAVFQQNQRTAFLQGFVTQAMAQLSQRQEVVVEENDEVVR